MLILMVLFLILIVGIICWAKGIGEFIPAVLVMVSGIGLFASLICLPISYYGIKAEICEFRATQETILANQSKQILERAAISQKIIEQNQWLAKNKYWNGTLFDIWIPDEITEMKPLREE